MPLKQRIRATTISRPTLSTS